MVKKPLSWLLVGIAFASMMLGGCAMPGEKARVQKNMLAYLQKTYGEEFVVEKPSLEGNEGFGYNTFVAQARAEASPELTFDVVWKKGEPGSYWDNYQQMKRSDDGKKEIETYLKQLYTDNIFVRYKLSTNKPELIGLKHDEVIKHGDDILFDLDYYVFLDGPFDKQKEADRVFQVVQRYIHANQIKSYFLLVYYLDSRYEKEFSKLYEDPGRFNLEFRSEKLYPQKKLINYVVLNHKCDVSNVSAIANEFDH